MPFVLIAAGVLGGAALLRFVVREGRRINRELDDARQARLDEQDGVQNLRRDPSTGTYRPG